MGDGRVALRFRDKAFERDFIARVVSDGTIKMFAYLALLHDPDPHPLLCIEEPENHLYPTLLVILSEQFSQYASRRKDKGQVFVTTHSPDFLNEVELNSIYFLRKSEGFTKIRRASDDPQLQDLINEGDKPGWLWRQRLFGNIDPC
ncbi:MAG: AAA family ATPase [Rhodobacteraceae bacterium]|nr:AAA family ATPase [Paracoccaceae bacterium]